MKAARNSLRTFVLLALLGLSSVAAWAPATSILTNGVRYDTELSRPRGLTTTSAISSGHGGEVATGVASSLHTSALTVAASMDVDSLPPVWIPATVAGLLLVGIGALQFSLGDVMSEEADLGISSGKP